MVQGREQARPAVSVRGGPALTHLTVIAIGERALRVVAGRSTPGGVEILRAGSAPLPPDFATRDVHGKADAIRASLAEAGGGNGRTALVLPRSMAILRDFDLPGGTAEEVLQMARFQIEKEMPLPIEQTRYSYVESPAPDGRLHVSVAAVPREQLDPLVAAVEDAGFKVQAAYVSSFGLASLLPDKPLDGCSALVGLVDDTLEVLIVDEGMLAFSRSVPMRDATPDALATEVNRTVLAFGARGSGHPIKRVLVAGEGKAADAMVGALKDKVGAIVEGLAVNGFITRREGVAVGLDTAAAAGVCVGALRGGRMPNVLRTPSVAKKMRLKPWQRLAILGGVIALGLIVWSRVALSDAQAEGEALKAELKSLEKPLADLKRVEDTVKVGRQWGTGRYSWAGTLDAIQAVIDPEKLWITQLTYVEGNPLKLAGKATDDRHVDDMVAELQKNGAVFAKVEKEFSRVTKQTAGNYKYDFSVRIQLAAEVPAKR